MKTLFHKSKDWKGLYGIQHDIALILESNGLLKFVDENVDMVQLEDAEQHYPDFGFHDECYQKFTNISTTRKNYSKNSPKINNIPQIKNYREPP